MRANIARRRSKNCEETRQIFDSRLYSWENVGTLDFNVYRCQKTGIERFRTQVPGSVSRTTDHINRTPEPSTSNISYVGLPPLLAFFFFRAHFLSHRTGVEVPIKPIQGVGGVTIDPPDQPYARIFFRYRPRGMTTCISEDCEIDYLPRQTF